MPQIWTDQVAVLEKKEGTRMFNTRHRRSSICGTVGDTFLVLAVSALSPPQKGAYGYLFRRICVQLNAPVSGIFFLLLSLGQ